jgi:hypothetical protein
MALILWSYLTSLAILLASPSPHSLSHAAPIVPARFGRILAVTAWSGQKLPFRRRFQGRPSGSYSRRYSTPAQSRVHLDSLASR